MVQSPWASGAEPVLTTLSEVTPKQVEWYWPGRIAVGKLSILSGDPGTGKSHLSLDLMARGSLGSRWPDCETCAPLGGSVLLSAEDDIDDTIVPRLIAAGANLTKIKALRAVENSDDGGRYERCFDLDRDLPVLDQAIQQTPDCNLVVIDPISAYMGQADSHNNSEVRGVLKPLAELAALRRVAVVAVSHLRKSEAAAVYRTMGSLAFAAAARAVWCVTKDKKDESNRRRLFLPVKNNLGSDQSGLAFELSSRHSANDIPFVVWEAEPVTTTADEALSHEPKRRGPKSDERNEAEQFLRDALANGPRPARDVESEAKECHGISKRTLDRARKVIGVEAFRESPKGPWMVRITTLPTTLPIDTPHKEPGILGNVKKNTCKTTKTSLREGHNATLFVPGGLADEADGDERLNDFFRDNGHKGF